MSRAHWGYVTCYMHTGCGRYQRKKFIPNPATFVAWLEIGMITRTTDEDDSDANKEKVEAHLGVLDDMVADS